MHSKYGFFQTTVCRRLECHSVLLFIHHPIRRNNSALYSQLGPIGSRTRIDWTPIRGSLLCRTDGSDVARTSMAGTQTFFRVILIINGKQHTAVVQFAMAKLTSWESNTAIGYLTCSTRTGYFTLSLRCSVKGIIERQLEQRSGVQFR